jgi:WD40-like Beta Propeller Repeat
MKTIFLTLGALAFALYSSGQYPDTEIYVADMKMSNDSTYFRVPQNITNHPGYDNQPCFSPNGASLYYVSLNGEQTDVMRYSFHSRKAATVTRTPESEFSPGLSPDGLKMTVVRIDTDSGQRAYAFPLDQPGNASVISGTDSIGYYCWLNDTELAMFILGSPHTLQVLNRTLLQRSRIAGDIGRCMKLSADSTLLYFVIKHSETDWKIHSYYIKDHTVAEVVPLFPGNEDFVVLKNGTLLTGDKGLLYALYGGKKKWKQVADFSASTGPFLRLAVNPQENKIALVVSVEKKP